MMCLHAFESLYMINWWRQYYMIVIVIAIFSNTIKVRLSITKLAIKILGACVIGCEKLFRIKFCNIKLKESKASTNIFILILQVLFILKIEFMKFSNFLWIKLKAYVVNIMQICPSPSSFNSASVFSGTITWMKISFSLPCIYIHVYIFCLTSPNLWRFICILFFFMALTLQNLKISCINPCWFSRCLLWLWRF